MGLVRPILVLRLVERESTSASGERRWREAQNLPRRVVLKAGGLAREGSWLSLALLRAGARGHPVPRVVAVEVRPHDPQHCTVIAALLLSCDLSGASRRALSRCIRTGPQPVSGGSRSVGSVRRASRGAQYDYLLGLLERREGRWLARISIQLLLSTPPRTSAEVGQARALCQVALAQVTSPECATIGLRLAESYFTGVGLAPADYRRLRRLLPRDDHATLGMIVAMAAARQSTASGVADGVKLRRLSRAETRARSQGQGRLAASIRVVRRYISWNAEKHRGDLALVRAYRANVLAFGATRLWLPISNLIWTSHETAVLSRQRGRYIARVLERAHPTAALQVNVAQVLYGSAHIRLASTAHPDSRRYRLQLEKIAENRFPNSMQAHPRYGARLSELCHRKSLGIVGSPPPGASHFPLAAGTPGFLERAWRVRGEGIVHAQTRKTRAAAVDSACLAAMRGEALDEADRRLLLRGLQDETAWSTRLILSMGLTAHLLGRGDVRQAAWACAQGQAGYRGLLGLRKRRKVELMPKPLLEYEGYCRQVLASFEPPISSGADPVRKLAQVARRLPRKKRARPRTAIDALDAVITAGQSAAGLALEQRVVEQLARMLGARVLFHRAEGRYVAMESQARHTLSSWTLRLLVREQGVVARRVKPKPEFWRPEQSRPGGVLCFPIGSGTACLARDAAFVPKEVGAVRTVLRFLAERKQPSGAAPPVRRVIEAPPRPQPRLKGLVGSSRVWRSVLNQVWKVAPTNCAILLRGETGTGKELLARAIHLNSTRAQAPFVPLNCAAINTDTMLSELFGHIRGAFTGATRTREGLVRRAHRGTLFLDEVGDMPAEMQVALLRALEERVVRPVGSTREQPADVRIISATNLDLDRLVELGTFREDLYHRLNVMELRLPTLRERIEDLPELVRHILDHSEHPKPLHMDALPLLARHAWPGNIRELDNVLRASALLSDGDTVPPDVIEQLLRGRAQRQLRPSLRLAPRAGEILQRLSGGWRSASELARDLGVSTRTINRELAQLMARGLVESFGRARARRYGATEGACRG